MSDLNERAYLKDKFKDFGAASDPATKSAVMSEIQKKRRKRRFFIIFFLPAFIGAIGVATLFLPTETDAKLAHKIKTESSKELDTKTIKTNHDSKKDGLLNDNNQKIENEGQNYSLNRLNNRETKAFSKQVKSNSLKSKSQLLKADYTNQENTSTQNEKKSLVIVSPRSNPAQSKRETSANSILSKEKRENNKIDRKSLSKDKIINDLSIKQLSLPQSKNKQSELMITDQNTSLNSSNKWIIGLSYSYVDLRSGKYDNEPVPADNSFLGNNSPSIELSDFQRVKNSMNTDLSIIRKFNNHFYIQSGLRYNRLNSITSFHQVRDHLIGVPIKAGYNIFLKSRWWMNLSAGINYNLSILRTESIIGAEYKNTFENFADFQLSTAEFNIGISYFVSEKISVNLSPQLSYLLFYKEQEPKRYFHRNLWFGGEFGLHFHLE